MRDRCKRTREVNILFIIKGSYHVMSGLSQDLPYINIKKKERLSFEMTYINILEMINFDRSTHRSCLVFLSLLL